MTATADVAILGAGPYGLSLAAHLRPRGVGFRLFGKPMQTWRGHMPKGMLLKSEGFASDLHAPDGWPLSGYCGQHGIPYEDIGVPVALKTFVEYGLAFQRRFVPDADERLVTRLSRAARGFRLTLDDGESLFARKVVLATGILNFAWKPPEFAGLHRGAVVHSADCDDMSVFAGKRIAVIGSGASAGDCAALAARAGAEVEMIANASEVCFHAPPVPQPRPLWERIRWPQTGLGTGWKSVFCVEAPLVFHFLPQQARLRILSRHLGPALGWFTRDEVEGKVPIHLNTCITRAETRGGRVALHTSGPGGEKVIEADHLITGTGYKVDLRKLSFLEPSIRSALWTIDGKPLLSRNFESSVPGLYFVGMAAGASFGPLVRFAFGARFTSKRLSRHLALPRPDVQHVAAPDSSVLSPVA
jgi:cation diffusion facilitator CzcD-associated flavoprotein CzcO